MRRGTLLSAHVEKGHDSDLFCLGRRSADAVSADRR